MMRVWGLWFSIVLAACYRDAGGTAGTPQNHVKLAAPSYAATLGDPLGFLPIDSELVMSLDARAVRASPVWKLVSPTILAKVDGELASFKQECGIDAVATVMRMSFGLRNVGGDHANGVLVIHGLDRMKLLECARKRARTGGAPTDGGAQVEGDVLTIGSSSNDSQTVVQFVGRDTCVVVFGPKVDKQRMKEVLDAGAPLRGSPAFTSLFERVQSNDALWLVMNGSSKAFDKMSSLGVRPHAIFGSLAVTTNLVLNLRMQVDTAASATALVTSVQGQMGMLKTMVDDLSFTAEDADVVLLVTMSDQKLQSLIGLTSGLIP